MVILNSFIIEEYQSSVQKYKKAVISRYKCDLTLKDITNFLKYAIYNNHKLPF